MDSWEWNKIIGAVLGTLVFVMVVKIAAEAIYDVPEPAKPGYVVEGVVEASNTSSPAAPVVEQAPDWGTVLPTADVAEGDKISARCHQCHNIQKGAGPKIGPDLWNVVDRPRAHEAGFSYSSAMKKKGGTWTYDELFHFLKSPAAWIPGTKMSFAGLRSEKQRIDLIAYLRTQADSPQPIPPPAPPAAADKAGAGKADAGKTDTGKAATGAADKSGTKKPEPGKTPGK